MMNNVHYYNDKETGNKKQTKKLLKIKFSTSTMFKCGFRLNTFQ